ncbi:hypothetical protein [Methylobrevis pamukkalensis]|nr:hypothetical protein [Methylobrevis pamukkalensis]
MSEPPRAVMWTIAQIVARGQDGSQPNVSKMVGRLVEKHGLEVERGPNGKIRAVNIAHYDQLRGRYGDPSKRQVQEREPQRPAAESYDEALRVRAWIDAENKKIDLALRKGLLTPTAQVRAGTEEAFGVIAALIDRLPNSADDLAAATAREGVHGLRVMLKKIASRMRADVATALQSVFEAAPESDEINDIEGADVGS